MSRTESPARVRTRRRGPWIAGGIAGALLLGAGGYTVAVAVTPLPEPQVSAADPAEWDTAAAAATDLAATRAQEAVAAQGGPAAAGWLDTAEASVADRSPFAEGDALTVWANDDTPRPIASITKLVTALVGLQHAPLLEGHEGPVYTWTAADVARQSEYLAQDGVAFPIPIGTEVTMRQMLTLMLLPSANDFAAAYAGFAIGDEADFTASVASWAESNGLESLTLVEPTGMDEANVASAADVVRIGRLALGNPIIAELTRTPSAELPWGIGEVENTNPLLTQLPGVVGLKTGRSSVAGFNLVTAQETTASGRPVVKFTAVLGRDSAAERARQSSALLTAMDGAPQPLQLVHPQELVGTATTVDGQTVELVADGSADTVLLPGEAAEREIEFGDVTFGPAGQAAGTIRATAPTGEAEVAVVTATAVVEPDLWWRWTHPALVFGWADPPAA